MMYRWLLNLLKNDVIFHLQRVQEETAVLLHANPLIGILHSLRVSSEVFLEKLEVTFKLLTVSDTTEPSISPNVVK